MMRIKLEKGNCVPHSCLIVEFQIYFLCLNSAFDLRLYLYVVIGYYPNSNVVCETHLQKYYCEMHHQAYYTKIHKTYDPNTIKAYILLEIHH